MTKDYLIECNEVKKNYGSTRALKGVDVKIPTSSIVGFIGPDGAGKSTLMKILLTLEKKDAGKIHIFGRDIEEAKYYIRQHVGYMPETFSLYPDLSVEENLKFFFQIYKLPKSEFHKKMSWLYQFNRLEEFKNTLASQLSGGMKQKLALSCALMNDPDLLILDEPTTGVDPVSRMEFWKMLNQLREAGKGIVISTPYLDEASQCDYIYLFYEGEIIAEGRPEELVNSYPVKFYQLQLDAPLHQVKDLNTRVEGARFYLIGDKVHFATKEAQENIFRQIQKWIGAKKLERIKPTLEDIFLDLLLSTNIDKLKD